MPYQINPDRNLPWNGLPELPLEDSCYRTLEIYEQLGNTKAALGLLKGRGVALPDQTMLINSISLQEAKASSEIENIFTTNDDLYKAFSTNKTEHTGPQKEILRYREALWEGYNQLKERGNFGLDYFILMYRQVKAAPDGFRSPLAPIVIRQGGSGPMAGNVVYTPPRGTGIVEKKLENLLLFLNDDEQFTIDPLLKMAIAHMQYEAIHPFSDGNGRTGRLLNIHCLTQKGLLDYPILYLSKYILENKTAYYSGLMGVTQRVDWKTWILFMLKAVEVTAYDTYHRINYILEAKEAVLKAIVQETDMLRPETLVNAIFTQPFTLVKHLTGMGLYAEATARKYLQRLIELQFLQLKVIQGNHYYMNTALCRILED